MHLQILLNTPDPIIEVIACLRIILPCFTLAIGVVILIAMPQQRLKKYKKNKLKNLSPGVRITTHGGDHGIVESFDQNVIVIHHNDGRKIELTPHALARIHHDTP